MNLEDVLLEIRGRWPVSGQYATDMVKLAARRLDPTPTEQEFIDALRTMRERPDGGKLAARIKERRIRAEGGDDYRDEGCRLCAGSVGMMTVRGTFDPDGRLIVWPNSADSDRGELLSVPCVCPAGDAERRRVCANERAAADAHAMSERAVRAGCVVDPETGRAHRDRRDGPPAPESAVADLDEAIAACDYSTAGAL